MGLTPSSNFGENQNFGVAAVAFCCFDGGGVAADAFGFDVIKKPIPDATVDGTDDGGATDAPDDAVDDAPDDAPTDRGSLASRHPEGALRIAGAAEADVRARFDRRAPIARARSCIDRARKPAAAAQHVART